ncbi:NADH dehydrogenase [ubiquinone] 1 alpha subcomplex subunit 9, mitochondrial [Ischnura elegans]|uniref:NADH dehydrogenase [ubiquinone] 1 alpha subcomplex subunit 9, mitochondrial n=1 Tax=Ischnura elegans TaxID=197161 RepID=UPI001ED86AA1|nr:NADH dehydrogenase [ubiquinone] 1 alpha subcomplex subunit 9, mitochondrial [Ischnura elegans]
MAALTLQQTLLITRAGHHPLAAIGIACSHYSTDVKPLKNPHTASLKRGTGGRSSFNGIVATVLGASGFIGRYVCNKLGKNGTQLIIPYRGDSYDVRRLKLVGDLGQVLFFPYDLRDENSLRKVMQYSNVVINLIGRDWETMNFKFEDVNIKGAAKVARIAREMGVEKLIHVSALNAAENPKPIIVKGGSKFLATKWHGENAVREAFPDAIIFRPSDVYGHEDRFLRYYNHVWRRTYRYLPLWKKGEETIKQPLAVSDLSTAIYNAIFDDDATGKVFQAVGPKRYKLSELVDWFYRLMRKDEENWGYKRIDLRWDIPFQWRVSLTQKFCPSWPVAYLGWDKMERDHVTDVVERGLPNLEDLGVVLTHMEDQVPWELRPFRATAYYDEEVGEFAPPAPPPVVV